jgi:aspartate carbamoyltransferase
MLLTLAQQCKEVVESTGAEDALKGRALANIFYEPSTRTSCSFFTAMSRLGGIVVPVNGSESSVKKGETLSDTIKTMACYTDVIVLRHPSTGAALEAAAAAAPIPVINAGDGTGEHPTQALLDLATIFFEFGKLPHGGMTVTMVGDLKHGRTVHSLAKLLRLFHVRFHFIAPPSLEMPEGVLEELRAAGCKVHVSAALEAPILAESDVVYVTRVQKERFESESAYEAVKGSYVIDCKVMEHLPERSILMHPLPRVDEISAEVDTDPRAAYFRQMRYGLFVRMALLKLVVGEK